MSVLLLLVTLSAPSEVIFPAQQLPVTFSHAPSQSYVTDAGQLVQPQ